VWQKLQSWLVTLMSAWLIWSYVLAETPVAESEAAVVTVEELVSPLGRLLFVPATDPPPFAVPWQALHVVGLATFAWNWADLLQALPDVLASARWHSAQSCPVTKLEP
jgi:hypothetical protein